MYAPSFGVFSRTPLINSGHRRCSVKFRFVVDIEVVHQTGKFVPREDISTQLQSDLEGAIADVSVNDSEYVVQDSSVDEMPEGKNVGPLK